jgi:hypothetical protein
MPIIDDTNNNNINKNNNNSSYNVNINNYQRINDKEVTNMIKYELQKDLLNKQKKSYNMMILTDLRNKQDAGYDNGKNYNIFNTNHHKRTKLTLIDLENNKDKNLKEIEQLLKGGIDDNKLMKLENTYKNNKEVMSLINNYKLKKKNLEYNNLIEEESSSNSLKLININRGYNKPKNIKDENNNIKLKVRAKSGKGLYHGHAASTGNLNYYNNNYFNNNNNQSVSSYQDYYDLSPFYYISNGNKYSKNMWGYNDKNNLNIECPTLNSNNITQDQIIQNKLRIYRDIVYKPFLDKVEREKINEYKRIQILRRINDPEVKSTLENKFSIQRGKIDLELNKEKAKINKAIRDYETHLILNENENKKILEENNIFFD